MSHVLLVVDTENYAGNFERKLCAYVTSQHDEYDDPSDINGEITHLSWWNDNIVFTNKEGVRTPVNIYPTEGWFNNGMGGHFRDDGLHDQEAKDVSVKSTELYYEPHIKLAEYRIANNDYPSNWTKEACETAIEGYKKSIEDAKTNDLVKYPAYLSVAISVSAEPPENVLEEFKERCKEFCDNHEKYGGKLIRLH